MNEYYNLTVDESRELANKEYKRKHNRRSKYLSLSPKKIFKNHNSEVSD